MFNNEQLEQVASELSGQGYCLLENALSDAQVSALKSSTAQRERFKSAGVGRGQNHQESKQVRGDQILWIEPADTAQGAWLEQMDQLKDYLNRRLFLGLFSFESHFAHYEPGAFYEKHLDAFRGRSNRVLSCVTYLNTDWNPKWGGELLLYEPEGGRVLERVCPAAGTMVIFLSEEFPHEVLPATQDRYSIAGWFRINSSNGYSVDPPA